MPESSKTAMKVVFGTMTIGAPGKEGARVHTVEDTTDLLDVFQKHGHVEIDNARTYGGGTSEEMLAAAEWQKRGLTMETKLYPTAGKNMGWLTPESWSHEPESLRAGLMASLKALKTEKLDMWYLHGPDRNTPFEATLGEVDKLHKEGYFDRFGISDYMCWEVAQMNEICLKNNWIRPTVYQGIYNALHRGIELELIPCLRHYGMSLYSFQPLAGGFLTSKYKRDDTQFEEGSRFDPKRSQGKLHQGRYFNDHYFDALDIIRPVAKKHGLTEAECALRWLQFHSQMKKELGDAIIIGASSAKQLEANLLDLEKGQLPEDVVTALNEGWEQVRGVCPRYFH